MNFQLYNIVRALSLFDGDRQADAIVNVIGLNPEKEDGILAQAIYKAAGDGVMNELKKVSARQNDGLMVTGAGNLPHTRWIFHAKLADYMSVLQANRVNFGKFWRRFLFSIFYCLLFLFFVLFVHRTRT